MNRQTLVSIDDHSSVGEARRIANELGVEAGFDAEQRGRLAIVVTEAATNILKHAGRGELILRPLSLAEGGCLELLAIDRGPGMSNVGRCLVDGYSTAGSPGTGLGAISRLASDFDIYSSPGGGTVMMARLHPRQLGPRPGFEVGVICLPRSDERVCGDTWTFAETPDGPIFMVADGSGHGPLASHAASEAARIFGNYRYTELTEILERAHDALRPTRGAAMAIAALQPAKQLVQFAGVGNIGALVANGQGTRSMVSSDGTVGYRRHRLQCYSYPWTPRALLVLYSDGLATHWRLDSYPQLIAHRPSVIAGVLYRDFRRIRDDVTVLVVRTLEVEP